MVLGHDNVQLAKQESVYDMHSQAYLYEVKGFRVVVTLLLKVHEKSNKILQYIAIDF